MPASNKAMINKLQTAINVNGGLILIDRGQFYSEQQERPITMYRVCTQTPGVRKKQVLFNTPSEIQVVLYLRDYWYWLTGKEIPKDNEKWNQIKKEKGIVFSEKEG